jgi:hypothetical protein
MKKQIIVIIIIITILFIYRLNIGNINESIYHRFKQLELEIKEILTSFCYFNFINLFSFLSLYLVL